MPESLHGGPSIEITCECQGGNTELCMERKTPFTYIANALQSNMCESGNLY